MNVQETCVLSLPSTTVQWKAQVFSTQVFCVHRALIGRISCVALADCNTRFMSQPLLSIITLLEPALPSLSTPHVDARLYPCWLRVGFAQLVPLRGGLSLGNKPRAIQLPVARKPGHEAQTRSWPENWCSALWLRNLVDGSEAGPNSRALQRCQATRAHSRLASRRFKWHGSAVADLA